ncbi:AAA family ATPase, partial [Streptosporangium algeriense]
MTTPQAAPPAAGSGVERSRFTFTDVAGMEEVKETLRLKLLLPVQQPELFAAFGKRAGGGVLLYGPPGAGKTHLARAAAGELGAAFVNVGLTDVLDMYIGSSERNLRAVFETAREHRPCVLFFDEVDALAARRSDMRHAYNRQLVNQFLAELDGVDDDANEGVLVLAATNAPWYVDVAFRRPGRFDRLVFVPPPDMVARAAILRILCRDKPLAEMDFDAVARITDRFTGADLKGVVDRAVEAKLQQSISAGRMIPLATSDLLTAAGQVKPTAVREWLTTARNYVLHANESGAWDELMPWIKHILAMALVRQGETAEAVAEADEAVRLAPGSWFAHYAAGQVRHRAGRTDRALSAVTASLALTPEYAPTWELLARVHIRAGRWDEAAKAARQGLRVDPEDADLAS